MNMNRELYQIGYELDEHEISWHTLEEGEYQQLWFSPETTRYGYSYTLGWDESKQNSGITKLEGIVVRLKHAGFAIKVAEVVQIDKHNDYHIRVEFFREIPEEKK